MVEQTVTLKSIETKTTKANKPMWTAITSAGKMSIFDAAIANNLFTMVNKNIIVDVETKNSFRNIVGFIGESSVAPIPIPTAAAIPMGKTGESFNPRGSRTSTATMLIAYAKDLCVAGKIEVKDIPTKAKELLQLYEEMLDAKFV